MSAPQNPPDPIRAARGDFDATGLDAVPSSTPLGEAAGDVIDRYKLLEEIGEGGMGSVWLAEQKKPVKRQVALKVIKLGMDTREVVVRFEAERQALALMDHPHIAKVLDGGATEAVRPYFVMELVHGTPITDYCDSEKTSLRERLELFTKVCAAVQHAHQKGIIHRDLKPGNVLVTLHDGVPVPKVIDFGIAKATDAELTQKTMFTQHAQILGTPEYMAPEQAGMSATDIDTRADVYALGALLYEMLTGTKLFEMRQVLEAGFEELLRTIREVDPPRPSTRISTLGEQASPIASRRHVNVESLRKRLTGDLDWIVMKALEKDRTRRYETANGLAADVARFLNQEPVVAAPPSALYRFRKFVRRRRKTVVAAVAIVFLLVTGSVGTGVGWWKTQQANEALGVALSEKDAALEEEENQRTLAQANERRARDAEEEARNRAADLEKVVEFQSSQISELDPELMGERLRQSLIDAVPNERRADLTEAVSELNFTNTALQSLEENLFDRTIEAIELQFSDQILIQAQLLHTVAATLIQLGLFERGSEPLRRAHSILRTELGEEHPETLATLHTMAELLMDQGKHGEAEACVREALDGARRAVGNDDPLTLKLLNTMGDALEQQKKLEEAEPYYREALDGYRRVFGDDSPHTFLPINNLGTLLSEMGRYDEAEPYYQEALDGRRRAHGSDHANTIDSISDMGMLLTLMGRYGEAEPFVRDAMDSCRRLRGDDHTNTLVSIFNLGRLLERLGRLEEAESSYSEAVEGFRRVLGSEHPKTFEAIDGLGLLLTLRGRHDEAEPYLLEALHGRRRVLGDEHPDALRSVANMAFLLRGHGKLAEAEAFAREALEGLRRVLGDDHPGTLKSITIMATLLREQGKLAEAEPFAREALVGWRRVLGDDHPDTMRSLTSMAVVHRSQVNIARQEGDDLRLGSALASHGSFEFAYRSSAAAEPLLSEALERLTAAGEEESPLQRVLSDLGAAIAASGRYAEAEPLLGESAEWMRAHPEDPAAGTALQRMVELYDAWHAAEPEQGFDGLAGEWRKDLEALEPKLIEEGTD